MTIGCNIRMICLKLNLFFYGLSCMLQFSQFVWALSCSVWDFFNNFLLIDATDRSKISSDQKRFCIALSLNPLSFFANTPFKAHDSYLWRTQEHIREYKPGNIFLNKIFVNFGHFFDQVSNSFLFSPIFQKKIANIFFSQIEQFLFLSLFEEIIISDSLSVSFKQINIFVCKNSCIIRCFFNKLVNIVKYLESYWQNFTRCIKKLNFYVNVCFKI